MEDMKKNEEMSHEKSLGQDVQAQEQVVPKVEEDSNSVPPAPYKKKIFSVRELVVIGMLGAITMLLGLTGYGFIQLVFMKATILHIPTIIGALLEGPRVGAMVGLIFGGFSVMQNIMAPTIMSFAFLNPLVSVLPRIFIGPFAYLVYKMVPIKKEVIRLAIAGFAGAAFNTVTVLSMIYFIYGQQFAEMKNIPTEYVVNVLLGVAVTNGIAEAIVSAIIVAPIVYMVAKTVKTK